MELFIKIVYSMFFLNLFRWLITIIKLTSMNSYKRAVFKVKFDWWDNTFWLAPAIFLLS